eukprot:10057328-Ditylum_brightwellii.AAC.1
MKEKYAKTNKNLDDEKGYGDGTKINIDGGMISSCKCPGCPGKKTTRQQSPKNIFSINNSLVQHQGKQKKLSSR